MMNSISYTPTQHSKLMATRFGTSSNRDTVTPQRTVNLVAEPGTLETQRIRAEQKAFISTSICGLLAFVFLGTLVYAALMGKLAQPFQLWHSDSPRPDTPPDQLPSSISPPIKAPQSDPVAKNPFQDGKLPKGFPKNLFNGEA